MTDVERKCQECIWGLPLREGRNYIRMGDRTEVREVDGPYIFRRCLNFIDRIRGRKVLVKGTLAECVKLSSFKIR